MNSMPVLINFGVENECKLRYILSKLGTPKRWLQPGPETDPLKLDVHQSETTGYSSMMLNL